MNSKYILCALGVAAALTVIAPAYAGSLGGGLAVVDWAAAWAAAFPG